MFLMWKYGTVSGDKKYMIKQVSDSAKYNFYAKTFIGQVIVRTQKKSPGVRCDECNDLWKLESSNIKSWLQNRGEKFKGEEHILNTPVLSEEGATKMTRFASIQCLNERGGGQLLEMVKNRLKYYREARLSFNIVHHASSSLKNTQLALVFVLETTHLSTETWNRQLFVHICHKW